MSWKPLQTPRISLPSAMKRCKLIDQMFAAAADRGMLEAVGLGLGASQVVAVEKTAGQVEKMEVVQPDLARRGARRYGRCRTRRPARRQAWAASISQLVPLPVMTIALTFWTMIYSSFSGACQALSARRWTATTSTVPARPMMRSSGMARDHCRCRRNSGRQRGLRRRPLIFRVDSDQQAAGRLGEEQLHIGHVRCSIDPAQVDRRCRSRRQRRFPPAPPPGRRRKGRGRRRPAPVSCAALMAAIAGHGAWSIDLRHVVADERLAGHSIPSRPVRRGLAEQIDDIAGALDVHGHGPTHVLDLADHREEQRRRDGDLGVAV